MLRLTKARGRATMPGMIKTTVRIAQPKDLRSILAMGEAMHHTSNFRHLEYDARHFGENLVRLLAGENSDVLLAERDGEPVGGLIAVATPALSSPQTIAQELGLYVRSDRRAMGAAPRLIKEYVAWARRKGAARITSGNSAGAPDDGFVKLLSREGFTRAGSIMYLEL